MSTNLSDCDAPAGGFERSDGTLVITGVVFSGALGAVTTQSDGTSTRTLPALSAIWDAPSNPYIVGVQFSYAPTGGGGETIQTSGQPPLAEAWKTTQAIVGGSQYDVTYRAVGVGVGNYGPWSTPETVTIDADVGPYSGVGEPTFDAPVGSTYQRQDVSQQWRAVTETVIGSTTNINIVGTSCTNPTHITTITGVDPAATLTLTKPSVATSGGALLYDAMSSFANDGLNGGLTWKNPLLVYGNNGGADVLLATVLNPTNHYATAALALAALQAQLPAAFTGYPTYKIVTENDPNPTDNRGGFSLIAQTSTVGATWQLMSDLSSVEVNGVEVDSAMTALNVVGDIVVGSTDGVGTVTVEVQSSNDPTLAGASSNKAVTEYAAKAYTDAKVAGLSWKQAVRAATTANITLSGAQTIDGVSVIAGDRVLVKNQSTASQNGLYVAASGAWTRSTDADSGAELVNASVYVSEGTLYAETQWTCATNAPITVGSTSLSWSQLSSGGGAAITAKDEGSTLTSALGSINFVGPGVAATNSGADVTVTIPGGSGGLFPRTLVQRTTAQSINNGAWTSISWSSAVEDTLAAWTSGTNVVVPAGITRFRLTADISWTNNTVGFRGVRITKGGQPLTAQIISSNAELQTPYVTDWITVAAGDVLTVDVIQSSGGALNVQQVAAGYLFPRAQFEWANATMVLSTTQGVGTSFPGSPATNDRYFRTDRGIEYFWNGTRWLSTQVYTLPLAVSDVLIPYTGTATDNNRTILPFGGTYDFWAEDYVAATFLNGGTSNGSNKWSMNLHNESGTTIATFDTSADTASAWIRHRVAINALLGSSTILVQQTATKTGAPGNLHLTAAITGRLVG